MTAEASGSVVRRILLGSQLRRLRESRGITREAAGYSIRASESKISRLELGRVSFKARDVEDLLTLYGVTDGAERESLLGLVREANAAGWWHSYGDVLPNWFQTYIGLEGAASLIRIYEVQFIHGLLQTEAYAHAVVKRGMPGAAAAEIDRRVALRLERQKVLVSENAPVFHAVLDEAALRRPYGDRDAMRGQLEHLIEVSQRPNVQLQVMPFSFGGHAGERSLHPCSFPRVGPPGHRLSGTAHQRPLPGQRRGSGAVRKGDGAAPGRLPGSRADPGSATRSAPTVLIRT